MSGTPRSIMLSVVMVLTALLAASSGQGADQDKILDDPFSLSLDELADVTVTVSSNRPERIVDTPAIISRYEADQLSGLGLRTLRDMLAFIPGVTVQDHLFGQTFVSIRGVYEGFNQKVLFLLDDTPYFMPSHSDIPLLGIPFEAISHIEVIRGPGAVYYGTNATGGVIKVVTRKSAANSLAVRAGANAFVNGGGYFNSGDLASGELTAAFELQRSDGYSVEYPAYTSGSSDFAAGNIDKREEISSLLLTFRRQGFTALGQVFESRYTGIAIPRHIENVNDLVYKGYLLSLRNDWEGESSKLTIYTDYNNFHPHFKVAGGAPNFRMDDNGKKNYRWRSGLNYDRELNDWLDVFLGAEHEVRSTEEYQMYFTDTDTVTGNLLPEFKLWENSLYGQFDLTPAAQWRFLIGGRYTDNSITGHDLVPRLAAIYQINTRQSLKLLYSVGFNSPSFTQLRADFPPVVEGNSDLIPETVETVDLAYTYNNESLLFTANFWRLQAEDFIFSERLPGEPLRFFNAGSFDRHGAEFDIQYRLSRCLKLFSGLTWYHQGNEDDAEDISRVYTPVLTWNLGAHYQPTSTATAGLSVRHIGPRSSADKIWLVNLDGQYRLGPVQLFATLENLLDDDVMHPNMAEFNDRLVPGGQGRNLKLGARYSF